MGRAPACWSAPASPRVKRTDASATGALSVMDVDALEQRRQYENYLLSIATGRHGPSAVVRTITTLQYGYELWKQEPGMRDAWAQRIVAYLDTHSCSAIPSSLAPVLPAFIIIMLIWFNSPQVRSEVRVRKRRPSHAADRRSSGAEAATDVIEVSSSSSDVEAMRPYGNAANFEEVYDADSIIDECVRHVAPEHVSMCDVAITNPCTHYLVKWAGYPMSNSSWTPAFLCSKSLVELYQQQQSRIRHVSQQQSRITHVASDTVRPAAPSHVASDTVRPAAPSHVASDTVRPAAPSHVASDTVRPAAPSHVVHGVAKKMPKLQPAFEDVSMLSSGVPITSIQQLKTRISVLNPDCRLRTRGRDRRLGFDTVRLGCKHVDAAHPCPLQLYYDVPHEPADAVPINFRRYMSGACTSNVCICCMSALSHDKLVYLFFPCISY